MHNKFISIIIGITCLTGACKKSTFLDKKSDNALVVPATLKDFQAILDNDRIMNGTTSIGGTPAFAEIAADNYYLTDATFLSRTTQDQNIYTWAPRVYTSSTIYDWQYPYTAIFYSNVVLDGLPKLTVQSNEQAAYNNIHGSALFYRAFMFYQLAEVFGQPFNKATNGTDLSIPLRLTADVNEEIIRSTVKEVYDRIVMDLEKAAQLLPDLPLYKTRPSRAATFALLAKAYLSMQNYDQALQYANSALAIQNTLIDYNTLTITASNFPIARFRPEVIFHTLISRSSSTLSSIFSIVADTNLYKSYAANDIRQNAFFRPSSVGVGMTFRGSYDGSSSLFTGLAVDEIYLISAECYARKDNIALAMQQLNKLLVNRWKNAPAFVPVTAVDMNDALSKILAERRKELAFRGVRWSDLRRLNQETSYAVTIRRAVNGQTYTLPANSPKYSWPIPDEVIQFNPGMQQNSR